MTASPLRSPDATVTRSPGLFVLIISVTALGGLLFGYDTAVISGAIGFLELHFSLTPMSKGWAGASAIVGCIPGSMCAGFLSDRFGRKKVLLMCGGLYAISGVASALPHTFAQFIIARFFGGLSIGASSMICPLYIAEIAPEKHRGRLGALFQLGIVIGILVVFFVNLLIQRHGTEAWNAQYGWRWMLGSEVLPAMLFLVCSFLIPESPRWLAIHNHMDRAQNILSRILGPENAARGLSEISAATHEQQGHLSELFAPAYRRPLIIAVGLAIFAQFSGINAIMYYAPEIFKGTGGSSDAAFASAVWVGVINLLFTFVAIAFVDKAGRRPLLVIGTSMQTIALAAVGIMFARGQSGAAVLICILGFVAAFAMAMGPIPWILISEIFPGRIRGRASSVGVFAIWVACFVVAQTFPSLLATLGSAMTFWIYGACSLASLIFVLALIPETKGKTLEEIESYWRDSHARSVAFEVISDKN